MANETTSTFTLALRDETSGPARDMASSLSSLKARIESDTRSLGEMQKALRNLKGSSNVSSGAVNQLRDRITAQRAAIAGAQESYLQLGGSFGTARAGAGGLVAQLQRAPGPLGAVIGRVASLGGSLGTFAGLASLAVSGVVALIGGIIAFTGAIAAAYVALGRYGLAQADARRSELLHLEGLTTLRTAYQRQTMSGSALQSSIDRVADSSALARGALVPMAEGLYRAGLRGRDLTDALDGLSIAQAVQGDRGAARFRAQAIGAARLGQSVRAVADDVRARLGPIATRMSLSWERQTSRLQEAFSGLFSGLHVEGPLGAFRDLVSLFSQSSATGRALRSIINVMFNGLLDGAGSATPVVRRLFQGMVIAALSVTIAVLRVRNAIRDAFSGEGLNTKRLADSIASGLTNTNWIGLGTRIVTAIGSGLLAYDVIVTRLERLYGQVLIAVGQGIAAAFEPIGARIVGGLIAGMEGARDRMIGAVAGLAGSATGALTSALQISSPSRVFAGLGRQIPAGVAMGVESGAGEASDAVAGMSSGLASSGSGNSGGSGGGATSIGPFYITIEGGGGGARAQADEFVDQVARTIEAMVLRRGATS